MTLYITRMERNKEWNGTSNGMEQAIEWNFSCPLTDRVGSLLKPGMEHGMEWNKQWNGSSNGMEQAIEWNIFCNMKWNEKKNVEWNGTDVRWYAECDCVISCACSLTYDFHLGRVEWNYELDNESNITVQSFY